MDLVVYADKNCQVKAFTVSPGQTCSSSRVIEIQMTCSNGQVEALNCFKDKWGRTTSPLNSLNSTNCGIFAIRLGDSPMPIFVNQACIGDNWSSVHLGNGVEIPEITEIPAPPAVSEIPVASDQSKPNNAPVMIVISVGAVLVFGLILLLLWYFVIRRVSRFRRKPLQECLVEKAYDEPADYEEMLNKVIVKTLPRSEPTTPEKSSPTATLAKTITLPHPEEDSLSTTSSTKSWHDKPVSIPSTSTPDPIPRPSMDPYRATPHYLPRHSTDSTYSLPQPEFTSTLSKSHTITNSTAWNTELVSLGQFVSLYGDLINTCTVTFKSVVKVRNVGTSEKKSFEKGYLIRTCVDVIEGEVGVKLREMLECGDENRDLVFKSFDSGDKDGEFYETWKEIKQRACARLVLQWNIYTLPPTFLVKLDLFLDRVIKFVCMKYAVGGNLICSNGVKFDKNRHAFEGDGGDLVYCLIPGLGRGEEVIFREIVTNVPLLDKRSSI